MIKCWGSVWGILLALTLRGQDLEGLVSDAISSQVLSGATISVIGADKGVITDENGYYYLQDLPPGRVSIRASYLGFESKQISDVWIKSGQTTNLDIQLNPSLRNLEEISVTDQAILAEPGSISITEEQINRFAATYYDPARLVTSAPDVVVANDQNNRVSVRGLAPEYNIWRLEGSEIVNPNHLSNAGTFLDQPTPTGGGVNMLSAQMLGRSTFLYGNTRSDYGNTIAGLFDMSLKKGNPKKRQYTAQASLIGLDFASEGPVSTSKKITYAANYRYSFTGLLTQFGVDFGGESIGFQDLAVNISSPVGERSEVNIFGIGGLSFNRFDHKEFEESEIEKDRSDIDFHNQTGIIGVKLKNGFDKGNLTSSLTYSTTRNSRDQLDYGNDDLPSIEQDNETLESISSLHLTYVTRILNQSMSVGLMANVYDRSIETQIYSADQLQHLIRPYVNFEASWTQNVTINYGIAFNRSEHDSSVDPRITLIYQLSPIQKLELGIGQYSQLLSPFNYYFSNPVGMSHWSSELDLIKSQRYTLLHSWSSGALSVRTSFFYYHFPEVNDLELNGPSAATYGGSLLVERIFLEKFYLRAGGSIFDSKIDQKKNHHYNNRYSLSFASGKDWDFVSESKKRNLSINIRGLYQGGLYYDPLDYGSGNVIPSYQTKPYLRLDLRIVWTRYRSDRTSSLALDLQNVANIQNEAYRYYDNFRGSVETQYQLGLIPILSYRVEW